MMFQCCTFFLMFHNLYIETLLQISHGWENKYTCLLGKKIISNSTEFKHGKIEILNDKL